MSYVGNVPTTAAFPFDQFSGNGSTTAFTLSYAPAGATSIIVSISGVVQNPNTYSVSGTTLTFTPAPPTGTSNIAVLYLGLPVVATLTPGNTAYFSSSVFTATASQTVFAPSGTYQVGFINVIRNGSQLAPADYTATNGTTVTLVNPCTAGDTVVIEVFNLVTIANALPATGGTVTGATTFNRGVNLAVSSGNVGIGTTSPGNSLQVSRAGADVARFTNTQSNGGDWQFKIGGGGFEDRRLMITDRFSGADNVRVGIDSNGNFQFNSGYGSAAVAYGCRAWVNFNGTGTVAIRGSGNVSSITDNGAGNYTVNLTTAMPDANYAVSSLFGTDSGSTGNGLYATKITSLATTSFALIAGRPDNGVLADGSFCLASVFR
jgi:hypothetical protein